MGEKLKNKMFWVVNKRDMLINTKTSKGALEALRFPKGFKGPKDIKDQNTSKT